MSFGSALVEKICSAPVVPGPSSFNVGLVDRFGNDLGTKVVAADENWDLRTLTPYNWAEIFLSREADWGVAGFYTDAVARIAVTGLVNNLHAANLWGSIFGIYPLIGGTAAKHKWNLRYPFDNENSLRLSFFNSPTHGGEGIKCLNLGSNLFSVAITDSPTNLGNHSFGHFSAYYRSYTPYGNNTDLRSYGDSRGILWHLNDPNAGNGTLRMGWCSGIYQVHPAPALTLNGHWTLNRPDAANLRQIRNGVLDRTIANASTTGYYDGAGNVYSNIRWGGGTKTMSAFTLGKGLSPAQEADLYTIIQEFQTVLGRAI